VTYDTFPSIAVPTFHTESMIKTEKLRKFFMEILPVAIKKKAHHTLFLFNLLTNLICKMSGSLHAILHHMLATREMLRRVEIIVFRILQAAYVFRIESRSYESFSFPCVCVKAHLVNLVLYI